MTVAGAYPLTVDQLEAAHWLLVGTTGSGKTFLARGLFEQLRRADRRVGAVDKLGKLWGLTLAANGKSPGLNFVIFGGKRAQIPMTPDQGAPIGRLFVERNIPAIFDLSQWKASDQERWVADFATAVFETNETAMHLLFDEAQSWVPLGGGGAAYEAVRLLAEQGRGNGINLLLTAPRISGLDANVRGAMAAMVAMRQTSDVDSKRTAEIVAGHLAIDVKAFRAQLPTLPTGTGFVWSPTGTGLERVSFPANATFDSSRTPRHGDTPPPAIAASSALVEELRAALAPPPPTRDKAKQSPASSDDSSELMRARARIVALETEVADLKADLATVNREADCWVAGIEDINALALLVQEGRSPGQLTLADRDDEHANLHPGDADSSELAAAHGDAAATVEGASQKAALITLPAVDAPEQAASVARSRPRSAPSGGNGAPPLNRTALDMGALFRAISPDGMPWDDALLLCGRRPNSGDSRAARKGLEGNGLIEFRSTEAFATPVLLGREDIGYAQWPSAEELLELWADKLRGLGGDMLKALAANGPADNAELGRRLGKSSTSGWWRKGRKDLLGSRVARDRDGKLQLHPYLEKDA